MFIKIMLASYTSQSLVINLCSVIDPFNVGYMGHDHGGGSLNLPGGDPFMFQPMDYQGGGSGPTPTNTHPTQHDYMGYHGGPSGLTPSDANLDDGMTNELLIYG